MYSFGSYNSIGHKESFCVTVCTQIFSPSHKPLGNFRIQYTLAAVLFSSKAVCMICYGQAQRATNLRHSPKSKFQIHAIPHNMLEPSHLQKASPPYTTATQAIGIKWSDYRSIFPVSVKMGLVTTE